MRFEWVGSSPFLYNSSYIHTHEINIHSLFFRLHSNFHAKEIQSRTDMTKIKSVTTVQFSPGGNDILYSVLFPSILMLRINGNINIKHNRGWQMLAGIESPPTHLQ